MRDMMASQTVTFLVCPQHGRWDRGAVDLVKAIAARDEVAIDPVGPSVFGVRNPGPGQIDIVQADLFDLVDDQPAGGITRRVQVFGDRRLAIGHHRAAGVLLDVDEEALVVSPGDAGAVVHAALRVQPPAKAMLAKHLDRATLEYAGADPLQHVGARGLLENQAVDAGPVQDVSEHQAGRTAADDDDLGSGGVYRFLRMRPGRAARA
ncbi:MAG: hypothetical protein R3E68_21200 [Burkholderiaceae bacterium]